METGGKLHSSFQYEHTHFGRHGSSIHFGWYTYTPSAHSGIKVKGRNLGELSTWLFLSRIMLSFKSSVQCRLYSAFVLPSECHKRPSPLTCAVDHEATFAVNVALVASQWQYCFWGRILQGSSSNMPLSWQSGEMCDSPLDAQLFMNIIF